MFEYQQKRSVVAKVLTLCAIGVGVGFGTCGLALLGGALSSNSPFASFIAEAGLILFWISLLGAVITLLVSLIIKIAETFQR